MKTLQEHFEEALEERRAKVKRFKDAWTEVQRVFGERADRPQFFGEAYSMKVYLDPDKEAVCRVVLTLGGDLRVSRVSSNDTVIQWPEFVDKVAAGSGHDELRACAVAIARAGAKLAIPLGG